MGEDDGGSGVLMFAPCEGPDEIGQTRRGVFAWSEGGSQLGARTPALHEILDDESWVEHRVGSGFWGRDFRCSQRELAQSLIEAGFQWSMRGQKAAARRCAEEMNFWLSDSDVAFMEALCLRAASLPALARSPSKPRL